jgi:ADP-ribose pyrophosphatase YjhB (NUDIX family)
MPTEPADRGISRPHALALAAYARLPRPLRVRAVRAIAPSHTVGALCLIEHADRILVLQQRHRTGWTLPGGLLNRGETAAGAVCREVAEETGLRIEVELPFAVVVEPRSRRVDVLFRVQAGHAPDIAPRGEAVHAAWLRPDELDDTDEPTAQALGSYARWHAGGAHEGRLLG